MHALGSCKKSDVIGIHPDDMYPLSWTTREGGFFMRYSYEFKKKCVEMYLEGRYPETPEGLSLERFHAKIRLWVRQVDANGPEVLKHQGHNKNWTPESRYELVAQVLAGRSNEEVAVEAGISSGLLYQWVRKYKTMGYNGLVDMKKGRKPKDPEMKKLNYNNPRKLEESEYEELIRLRAENEAIKAEIEVIKKEIALREEREAARLKAKKQRSSKNSGKKGIS